MQQMVWRVKKQVKVQIWRPKYWRPKAFYGFSDFIILQTSHYRRGDNGADDDDDNKGVRVSNVAEEQNTPTSALG